jgi:hypothetical protein
MSHPIGNNMGCPPYYELTMGTVNTVATLAKAALWRLTGSERLAVPLIETALRGDEDSATVAAMMLTKGGRSAIRPVSEAIARGNARLVGILVGIGSDEARNALAGLATSPDAAVAEAARAGVERIDRARRLMDGAG